MSVLILIPARAGSTRVKNKNLRTIKDIPLVAHVIQKAVDSQIGRVVVSTNSTEIKSVAQQFGAEVPFLRPDALSTASASSLSCILHTLHWFQENENWSPEMVAFCPPTNPFWKAQTLQHMRQMLLNQPKYNSAVTITACQTHPFRVVRLHPDNRLENGIIEIEGKSINDIERSQDWPETWEGSPACRFSKSSYFLKQLEGDDDFLSIQGKTYDTENCLGYPISSLEAWDIDEENDFLLAQKLIEPNL
jgi:CMP-N-acetylneuraminic acid synthetase